MNGSPRIARFAVAGLVLAAAGPQAGAAPPKPTIATLVGAFANAAIADGSVEGVEVAVVRVGATPQYFGFGVSDITKQSVPTPDTLYQIASITKVFTTNLLGQAVSAGTVALNTKLGDFATVLGVLPTETAAITLQDLADFTGGIPTLAPVCAGSATPGTTGCLPSGTQSRPDITQYTGADLATFYRTYQTGGPPPHDYLYSDFAIGLTGLLLGASPAAKLGNVALTGWEKLLAHQLTTPLGMTSTFLTVPSRDSGRLAPGYTQAQATPIVSGGGITGMSLTNPGAGYVASSPPAVLITGGGGKGAAFTAVIDANGGVGGFKVQAAGSGYIAPPDIAFSGCGTSPVGRAIVAGGKVIAVDLLSGGACRSVPTVSFSGGRVGGVDATAIAFVDHDLVTTVQITHGGQGYVPPVAASIAPGAPSSLAVPVWAPAGALKSTAHDLARFAAAALGATSIGNSTVPASVTAGFSLSETPYACEAGNPSLTGCTAAKSGLAWDILNGAPETVAKDGGLPGYSTYLILMPGAKTAILVLTNSWNGSGVAPRIGSEILYALYHAGLIGG